MIIETLHLNKKERQQYNEFLKAALVIKDAAVTVFDDIMREMQAYYKELYNKQTGLDIEAADTKALDDFLNLLDTDINQETENKQSIFEEKMAAIDVSDFYFNVREADIIAREALNKYTKKIKNVETAVNAAQKVLNALTLDDLKLYIHLYIDFTSPIGLISHFTFIKLFLHCYDLEAYNVQELEEKGELLSNARNYIFYNEPEKGHTFDYGEDAPYIITNAKDFNTVLIFVMGVIQEYVDISMLFKKDRTAGMKALTDILQACYEKASEFCPPPADIPKQRPMAGLYLLNIWREQFENYMLDISAVELPEQDEPEEQATPNDTEQPPKEETPLVSVTPRMPKKFISISDKVSDKAFSEVIGEPLAVRVSRKDSKKQITTLLNLELYDETSIVGLDRLTPYDRAVHDAIVTVCIEGGSGEPQMYMTPQTIYRTMTGNFNTNPRKEAIERINESLRRLGGIRIKINADDEMKAFYKMPSGFQYEGAIVPNEIIRFKSNGAEVEGIHLLRTPILYSYASIKKQVSQEDIKLLATPVKKTEENIILQDYLFRRVSAMKHSPKLSRNILYTTVYDNIQVTAASIGALRKKRYNIRENIKSILDYWKEQGFIKAYKENYGAKNESISVSIILS